MSALTFPCTIFKTKNRINDYGARDMRCGDLSEAQLKAKFGLAYVSKFVDPYKLIELPRWNPSRGGLVVANNCKSLSKAETIKRLFDEFRASSSHIYTTFGFYGDLIIDLINHMQHKNGAPYRSIALDRAIERQILDDNSDKHSTRLLIQQALIQHVDWEEQLLPVKNKQKILNAIMGGILPKFTRFKDNFNGMGLAVHDTYATHITMKSLRFGDKENFTAMLHYKIQDHFGLDDTDILNFLPRQFDFFRIWFVLQRYNKFAIKPFMTNMEATVTIRGNIRDKKK